LTCPFEIWNLKFEISALMYSTPRIGGIYPAIWDFGAGSWNR